MRVLLTWIKLHDRDDRDDCDCDSNDDCIGMAGTAVYSENDRRFPPNLLLAADSALLIT